MWSEWRALLLAAPAALRAGPESRPSVVPSPAPAAPSTAPSPVPSATTGTPVAGAAAPRSAARRRRSRPRAGFVPSEKIDAGVAVAFSVDI